MRRIATGFVTAGFILVLLFMGYSWLHTSDDAFTATGKVKEDNKFGAALTDITFEEFTDIGFETGDSCDIVFGNGYSLDDVPLYNGWYVKDSDPVIICDPNIGNIRITLNNIGIWKEADLSDGDTVTITLNEKSKYSQIQEIMGQETSNDRKDYDSDEQYCNFRALTGGNIKSNFIFRGASSVDNRCGRVSYVNALLESYGIQYIVDLANNEEEVSAFMKDEEISSSYAASLYESDKLDVLGLGLAYKTDDYKQKIAKALIKMMKAKGPVYIHCLLGRDRTGFVSILLESIAGATYDEMLQDYMLSFTNYNSITEEGSPSKFEAISTVYFVQYMEYLHGSEDQSELKEADYTTDVKKYLMDGGMTEKEIESLREFIQE